MKRDKKSFVLYHDTLSIFDKLSDQEGMILFKAIRDYSENVINGDEKDIEIEDKALRFLFDTFKMQLIRDNKKYEEISKKRSEYGKKGAEARHKNKKKQQPQKEEFIRRNDPNAKEGDTKVVDGKRYWYQDNYWCEEV